jgi:DNA-binding IclR family transcriptional regulator
MSVKSAKRVLDVFELLNTYLDGLTVKEISNKLSLPQSSTFELVKTLNESNYLSQNSEKKYKLGPKLIHLGTGAMESLDITSVGTVYLKRLMEKVQETVFMAILSGDELIYVAKIDSNRSIKTTAQIGLKKPLYCTGLGKAFLTFMREDEREKLLDNIELKKITNKTITDRKMLKEKLDEFYKQGYAVDDEENEEGLYCLAAPVFGYSGKMYAAISVAGPKQRMLLRRNIIVDELVKTAHKISIEIGYYGDSKK